MIQYRQPVRLNVLQVLQYTFQDQSGNLIDLTPYQSAFLEVKLQGQVYQTVSAVIVLPATTARVRTSSPYMFAVIGIWTAQFYVQDQSGNKLFGEPLQLRVVVNVEDLALNQLLVY